MRLYYNGRTIEDLKKYLEEKVRDLEELKKLLEEKDKEDYEFMVSHQGDNMRFSG